MFDVDVLDDFDSVNIERHDGKFSITIEQRKPFVVRGSGSDSDLNKAWEKAKQEFDHNDEVITQYHIKKAGS